MFATLYKYRNLVSELVVRDIKTKYRRSVLGVVWSLLNPLMMLIITAMVFSNLFRFNVENYVLYLICGQVLFSFYAESTSLSIGAILGNASLIKKVYIPKYLFVVSRVLSSGVNLCFMMPALIAVMFYTGAKFSLVQLTCIVPLGLFLFFCMGVGLFLSAAVVFFRDINHLYGVLVHALSFATPIFYPENIIPEKFAFILTYNPIYYFLKLFRMTIVGAELPGARLTLACFLLAAAAMALGSYVFNKSQNKFVLYV